MATVEFTIEGFKEINTALKGLEAKAKRRLFSSTMRKAITPLREEARLRVNVKTGNLRRSIRISVNKIDKDTMLAKVQSDAPHAHLVEFGHNIVFLNKKTGKKFIFGRTREFPFMSPAFEYTSDKMMNVLTQEIKEALELE